MKEALLQHGSFPGKRRAIMGETTEEEQAVYSQQDKSG